MSFEEFLEKSVLENAAKYKGKANPKALIGKVLGSYPDKKADMKQTMQEIAQMTDKINTLSLDEQTARLNELGGPQKTKEKEKLKPLTDAKEGNVIMRFAPSPSGPMHIGHAITGGLTSLYVKKYNGKFILRIEDTNSDNIYKPAYELLKQDADWIFGNVSEVIIQSDRMDIYYKYAREMIEKGLLYVDFSSPDEFKEYVEQKIDPKSKQAQASEQLARFEQMIDGTIKQGEAVVRFKGDMAHKNPAMRDFPLFRINESEHPRQGKKYRVWPLMNFSVFVDDLEMGMTHIIRAKDHADNAKRQELLYESLGKKPPISYFTGRYKFTDLEISASKTRAKIEAGEFSGWDDIRLPFLEALRRRGFHPHSLLRLTEDTGLSSTDKVVNQEEFFKNIIAHNKDLIDEKTNRYFMVRDPVSIKIDLQKQVELDLHPNNKKGGRVLSVNENILIEDEDAQKIHNGLVRLADLVNIDKHDIVSQTYDEYKSSDNKQGIIHWLPDDEEQLVMIEVHMPDGEIFTAQAERNIAQEQVGTVVQFERFGFARLDEIRDDILVFWFAHN